MLRSFQNVCKFVLLQFSEKERERVTSENATLYWLARDSPSCDSTSLRCSRSLLLPNNITCLQIESEVKEGKITQNKSGKNYSNLKIQAPFVGDRETRSKNSRGSI